MKLNKIFAPVLLLCLAVACAPEKVQYTEMKGYSFQYNPKGMNPKETIGLLFDSFNRQQAKEAAENNKETYTGFGVADSTGNVQPLQVENTDYMIITQDSVFQKMLQEQRTQNYSGTPQTKVDFNKEFLFLLIHPPAPLLGAVYYDNIEAEVAEENTVLIKPLLTALPYAETSTSGIVYGNRYQVEMYKLPKQSFKRVGIVFTQDKKELPPVYVSL